MPLLVVVEARHPMEKHQTCVGRHFDSKVSVVDANLLLSIIYNRKYVMHSAAMRTSSLVRESGAFTWTLTERRKATALDGGLWLLTSLITISRRRNPVFRPNKVSEEGELNNITRVLQRSATGSITIPTIPKRTPNHE